MSYLVDRWLAILRRLLRVVPETPATFSEWVRLVRVHQVVGAQVHDANLVAIMTVYGIDRILTLNVHDFRRYPGIAPLTPAEVHTTHIG